MARAKVLAAPAVRRVFSRRGAGVLAGVVFAAALAFAIFSSGGGPDEPKLPGYVLAISGDATSRADATVNRLRVVGGAKGRFELVARPEVAIPERVAAFAFTLGESGSPEGNEPSPLDARTEIGPSGEVRMSGGGRALAGSRDVRLVLGRATAFARFEDAVGYAKSGRGNDRVRVFVVPIDPP